MNSLFLALMAGITGAALRWFLPACSEWLRTRHLAKNLRGTWNSTYQSIEAPENAWIEETVELQIPFLSTRLVLKNKESSHGYNYTAAGLLKADAHIFGEWDSIRPGANALGAFMLTIDGQGEMMCGYWVGSNKSGARRYGRWVLARPTAKLLDAKQLLEKMSPLADLPCP